MRHKPMQWTLPLWGSLLIMAGCPQQRIPGKLDLQPDDSRPLYTLQVEDGTEAKLLEQELGLDILRVDGKTVYFFGTSRALLDKLDDLGYTMRKPDPMESFFRVVKITKKGKASDLTKRGLHFINREDRYWVFRGNLRQLKSLQKSGYQILPLDQEVRPRTIKVLVKTPEEVQRVAQTAVDIYSAEKQEDGRVTIYAGAFDYQIDLLTSRGYQVVPVP